MMAAELDKAPYSPGSQLLVIRNYGASVARQVQVTFDPPIPDPNPDRVDQSVSPFIKQRYAKPIPVVTPGMELSNIWFSAEPGHGGAWENYEPTPDQFTVTIAYEGPDGTAYTEDFPLDTDLIKKHTLISSSREPENRMKEAAKSLAQIEKSVSRIARSVNVAGRTSQQSIDDDPVRMLLGERRNDQTRDKPDS